MARTFEDLGIDTRNAVQHEGGNWRTLCPNCSADRKPEHRREKCLSFNPAKGAYHCFNECGFRGYLDGPDRTDWREQTRNYAPPIIITDTSIDADTESYFAHRGIARDTLERAGVVGTGGVIKFPYHLNGQHINTKYRRLREKKMKMDSGARLTWYGIDRVRGASRIAIVEGECLTGEAEVLTHRGWVRFDEYAGEDVAQVHEGGRLEMVEPLAVVRKHYTGDLLQFTNQRRFVTTVTPGHRMIGIAPSGEWRAYRADSRASRSDVIPRVGHLYGDGIPLSDDQIAFSLAVSADASIRENAGRRYAVFGLKKPRKIERLRGIIDRLGIKASDNAISNGYQSICMMIPDWVPGRELPHEWIVQASMRQRDFILEEMVHWDGNSVPNRNQTEYSTKHYHNAVFMQSVAHTSGRTSTIMRRSNRYGEWFKVSILHGKQTTCWQKAMKEERVHHDGMVYCVTVPTGMFLVRDQGCIYVTGNCDYLTWLEVGLDEFAAVVSLPNGAQTGTMAFFPDIDWDSVDQVYLAGDMDEAGEKCVQECAARIGKEKCWRVRWPENDANATLVEYGREAVWDYVMLAQPFPIEGIEQPGDEEVRAAVHKLYREGLPSGLSTGFAHLDKGMTLRTEILDMLGGYPGSGKSELLDQLVINAAVMHGWRIAMFSPENFPVEFHLEKLARKYVGKPFKAGKSDRMTPEELDEALDWLNDHVHFLRPEYPTFEEVMKLAKIEKRRFGVNWVTIDPWNTMIHSLGSGESVTDYVARQLSLGRQELRNHTFRLTISAHPRKPMPGNGKIIPGPYEMAGSHNFFAMADSMWAVGRYKNDLDKPVEVHIQKVRHSHLGSVGVCSMHWLPATGRYQDVDWSVGGVEL